LFLPGLVPCDIKGPLGGVAHVNATAREGIRMFDLATLMRFLYRF